jgi:hypothetical protein
MAKFHNCRNDGVSSIIGRIVIEEKMELDSVIDDVLKSIIAIDSSREPFKAFQPGVGPYGEPQLLKLITNYLNHLPQYDLRVVTKRTPDLLIHDHWALEFKIARPFGDNGKEAEDWSVNLLHPYTGNVSSIGDCFKLLDLIGKERLGVVVIGYEHTPPKIDLNPLIEAFEAIAEHVAHLHLSPRIERRRDGLVHPVHQAVRIFAWEVINCVS